MNKAFEKILKKIEEKRNKYQRLADGSNYDGWNEEDIKYTAKAEMCEELKEIVQEVAEEYKDGWIPCSERLPENDNYILLSFENFSVPMVGRYEEDETGGAFYIGDEDETCISQDLYVNAWQPLPEPLKERD